MDTSHADWKRAERRILSLTEKPGVFVGIFLGTKTIRTADPKNEGKTKPSTLHRFRDPDNGTIVDVWGFGMLDRELEVVPRGNMVKVEYFGMQKNEKRNRDEHLCQVFFAPVPADSQGAENDDLPF